VADVLLDAQLDMDQHQLQALSRDQATKKQDRYRERLRTMTIQSYQLVATATEEVLGLTELN